MTLLRDSSKKHITIIIIFMIALTVFVVPKSVNLRAASITSETKKARKAYKSKISSINKISNGYCFKVTDILGNKVPELLIWYFKEGERHGSFKIYTYKNSRVKTVMDIGADNLEIKLYRKTNTLVISDSYHDYSDDGYYRFKNGKYRLIALKCKNPAAEKTRWYEDAKRNMISKAKFDQYTKKLKKGSQKTLDVDDWEYHK